MARSVCRILFVLLAAGWCMSASATECETTLRIASHGVWREANTAKQENSRDQLILSRVAVLLNWCLSWEERDTNITRRLAMIRDGEVDALIGASKTPDRASYSWFSNPYRDEAVQLFVRSGEHTNLRDVSSFDALLNSDSMLLALRDCWLGPDYARRRDELIAMHRVSEVDSYAQGRSMLLARRADVFIAPDTFSDFLHVESERGIEPLAWQPYRSPVYFMFSRKTVSLQQVKQFNEALAEVMRTSARF